MKLFMRNFYDQPENRVEIKDPMEYEAICISCAGKLGGKIDRWLKSSLASAKCDVCGNKTEVTSPKEYIWR